MLELIQAFLESRTNLNISVCLTVPLSILFIYLYFRKSGRDERGRGIFATSCFVAMCVYLVLTNIMTALPSDTFANEIMVKNIIVFVYNLVLIVHIVCTAVIGKIR